MKSETTFKRKNATVNEDGVYYREIADAMTLIGHVMNHSSIRNYIIRSMTKFAQSVNNELKLRLTKDEIKQASMSADFQNNIISCLKDILDSEELEKNDTRKNQQ